MISSLRVALHGRRAVRPGLRELHERLNQHFDAINDRVRSSCHYWAENSREMLALVDDLGEMQFLAMEVIDAVQELQSDALSLGKGERA